MPWDNVVEQVIWWFLIWLGMLKLFKTSILDLLEPDIRTILFKTVILSLFSIIMIVYMCWTLFNTHQVFDIWLLGPILSWAWGLLALIFGALLLPPITIIIGSIYCWANIWRKRFDLIIIYKAHRPFLNSYILKENIIYTCNSINYGISYGSNVYCFFHEMSVSKG